jgi:hypothetical protein
MSFHLKFRVQPTPFSFFLLLHNNMIEGAYSYSVKSLLKYSPAAGRIFKKGLESQYFKGSIAQFLFKQNTLR